jgi:hypothetical protein
MLICSPAITFMRDLVAIRTQNKSQLPSNIGQQWDHLQGLGIQVQIMRCFLTSIRHSQRSWSHVWGYNSSFHSGIRNISTLLLERGRNSPKGQLPSLWTQPWRYLRGKRKIYEIVCILLQSRDGGWWGLSHDLLTAVSIIPSAYGFIACVWVPNY